MADELNCTYHSDRVNPINADANAALFRKIKINGHYGRVLPSLCTQYNGYKYSLICHDTESIVSSSARDVLLVISICIILLLLMIIFVLQYKRRAEQNEAMRMSKASEAKLDITEKVLEAGNENV